MKRETRVLLLRHAETAAPELFHGAESDIGLGARGFEQAEAVATALAALRPDALYCSAMRRAVETAATIGRTCDLVPRTIPTLHEQRIGPLSGQSLLWGMEAYKRAVSRWVDGDLEANHEGGESYADIRRRALPAFETLVADHPGGTIVVVIHGVVIRVLLTTLLEGYGPEHFSKIAIPNAVFNDLRYDATHWHAEALASPG